MRKPNCLICIDPGIILGVIAVVPNMQLQMFTELPPQGQLGEVLHDRIPAGSDVTISKLPGFNQQQAIDEAQKLRSIPLGRTVI